MTSNRPNSRRRLFQWLVAIGTVLFCILGTELFLQVRHRALIRAHHFFGPSLQSHKKSDDAVLVYEFEPGAEVERDGVSIRINPQGFRDDPFPEPIPTDAFRIVVLGDSVAFGWGVEMDEAFPQLVERELRESDSFARPEVVVFNLAVDGYSTEQQIRLLGTRVADFEPDLVLISYVLNDPDTYDGGLARYYQEPGIQLLKVVDKALWNVRNGLDNTAQAQAAQEDYHQFIHARYADQTAAQFARIGELAQARGWPIWVAITPLLTYSADAPYAWQNIHDTLIAHAESNGLHAVDLIDSFKGVDGTELQFELEYPDPWHPTARGHELIAEALVDEIEREFGVQPARAPEN